MDINDWRGVGTILCLAAFLAIVWWAYGPSRRDYFDRASKLPFADADEDRVTRDEEKTGE